MSTRVFTHGARTRSFLKKNLDIVDDSVKKPHEEERGQHVVEQQEVPFFDPPGQYQRVQLLGPLGGRRNFAEHKLRRPADRPTRRRVLASCYHFAVYGTKASSAETPRKPFFRFP